MASLLPPSIQDERCLALERVLNRQGDLPVSSIIGSMYVPASCPEVALEYLGHQFGLLEDPIWILAGTAATRRELLYQALGIQGTRGTISTIKRALAAIGWEGLEVTEKTNTWAHYRVTQPLDRKAVTAERLQLLRETLEAWAPARCVLEGLDLGVTFTSNLSAAIPIHNGTYTHNGAIKYEGLPVDTLSYVKVGSGTPTVQISTITTTRVGAVITVSFEVGREIANGLDLDSYALYSAAGTVIASASTVVVHKTSDVALQVTWTINLTA